MKGDDKRNEITAAAEKMFSENGFEATSTRDIAAAANVNIAMISYYFGSKEHLLEEIIDARLADLKIDKNDVVKEGYEPEQQLEEYISLLITKLNRNTDFYNVLHSELTIKRRVFGGEKYNDIKQHNDKVLQAIIEQGQKKGIFSSEADADVLQVFIIGPYVNFVLNKKILHAVFEIRYRSKI